MGMSIHYSGYLKERTLLPALAEEIKDICESLGWEYHYFEAAEGDELEGIYFAPADCEPLFLTFTPEGRLLSPISQLTRDMLAQNGLRPELIYTISCKTQQAGMHTHIALIRLFRYLSNKYFREFVMDDEGGFWESDEQEVLQRKFMQCENAIKALTDVLADLRSQPLDAPDSLAWRIEQLLRERRK